MTALAIICWFNQLNRSIIVQIGFIFSSFAIYSLMKGRALCILTCRFFLDSRKSSKHSKLKKERQKHKPEQLFILEKDGKKKEKKYEMWCREKRRKREKRRRRRMMKKNFPSNPKQHTQHNFDDHHHFHFFMKKHFRNERGKRERREIFIFEALAANDNVVKILHFYVVLCFFYAEIWLKSAFHLWIYLRRKLRQTTPHSKRELSWVQKFPFTLPCEFFSF